MNKVKNLILKAKHEADTNWLKATQVLYRAIEEYPDEASLYDELGNLYYKKNLFHKAAELFETAHNIDNTKTEITFKLAHSFLLSKQFEKSAKYFGKIKDIHPEAAYNRCVALCELRKREQALIELEKLTSKYFESVKPFLLLSKLYMDFQRNHKALKVLDNTEKMFGGVKEVYHLRAVAYFNIRKWIKAYLNFSKVEQYSSLGFPVFYRMFALTSERIGKTDKAIELLKTSIREHPKFFSAYYDLIRLYYLHDRSKEAKDLINELRTKYGLGLRDIIHYQATIFDDVLKNSTK